MLFFRFSRSQMLDQRTEFLAEKNTRTWRKERRKGKKIEPKLIRKERKTKKKLKAPKKRNRNFHLNLHSTFVDNLSSARPYIFRKIIRTPASAVNFVK